LIDGNLIRLQTYEYNGDTFHHRAFMKTGDVADLPQLTFRNNVIAITDVNHGSYSSLQETWAVTVHSSNNYYLNLSDTPLPSNYPMPPAGWTVLQGQAARDYWALSRDTWIANHDGSEPLLPSHAGSDKLFGLDGNDVLDGGQGNDSLYGGLGSDFIDGSEGNDLIFGEAGGDFQRGGAGGDYMEGGAGNDDLLGNEGVDLLNGGLDEDDLWGGADTDVFRFAVMDQKTDVVHDFIVGQDRVSVTTGVSIDSVIASAFTTAGGSTLINVGDNTWHILDNVTGINAAWFDI
jgi:Ca2+-binding RTX toxin-like protein